jgi:hypothetical protein
MRRDDPRHGTYAGWQVHQREGKQACRPRKDARNAYIRDHRTKNDRWRESNKARAAALVRLSREHKADFDRIYAEELTRLRAG